MYKRPLHSQVLTGQNGCQVGFEKTNKDVAQLFDPKNIILKQSAKLQLFLFQVFSSFFFLLFFRSKMAAHES